MYKVTLVHLTADARSTAVEHQRVEKSAIALEELRELLRNFCEIDPVDHAGADAEIRVQSPSGSWLMRAGQRKLILYDALDRESPGHIVTAEEALAEIDGTASAARAAPTSVQLLARAGLAAAPADDPPAAPPASRRRRAALAAVAVALAAGIAAVRLGSNGDERPADFRALAPAEAREARASLAGVYLTGVQPGQHGIVLTPTGHVRLFEFHALEAPRVVQATVVPGRVGAQLGFATDQPGGVILVGARHTLIYCGETYTRLP